MTYLEIIKAVEQGKNVYWTGQQYRVFLQDDVLYEIGLYNDSMCKLQESQYEDCFIGA